MLRKLLTSTSSLSFPSPQSWPPRATVSPLSWCSPVAAYQQADPAFPVRLCRGPACWTASGQSPQPRSDPSQAPARRAPSPWTPDSLCTVLCPPSWLFLWPCCTGWSLVCRRWWPGGGTAQAHAWHGQLCWMQVPRSAEPVHRSVPPLLGVLGVLGCPWWWWVDVANNTAEMSARSPSRSWVWYLLVCFCESHCCSQVLLSKWVVPIDGQGPAKAWSSRSV